MKPGNSITVQLVKLGPFSRLQTLVDQITANKELVASILITVFTSFIMFLSHLLVMTLT